MNRQTLIDRVRLAVGLPLLGMAPSAAACEPQVVEGSEPCGQVLEITPENRAALVAEFAGDRTLGAESFATRSQREAWVESCFEQRAEWPARCDLRAVVALDPAWWDQFPDRTVLWREASLYWYGDREDEPICTRNTLLWGLSEEFEPKGKNPSNTGHAQSLRFDALSGEPHGELTLIVTMSGRPFEGRLAACPPVEGPARHWVRRAREEHASVAAFARHALELMALGAPLDLLDGVARAQADEVRHARLCLERAAALGARVELGALPTEVPERRTPFAVALGVALEGCVNETVSALELIEEAQAATGAERALLEQIAGDEVGHAELAWQTLRWLAPQLSRRERRRIRTAMLQAMPTSRQADLEPCIRAAA